MTTNKLLQSLSEDPQLEKQIGCMTGILQLFDRHQVLTGRRLYGHKRISSGDKARSVPSSSCGSPKSEGNGSTSQNPFVEETLKPCLDSVTVSKTPLELKQASQNSSFVDKKDTPAIPPPLPLNKDTAGVPMESREQARVSLDVRGSIRFPYKLDSSRSLREGRVFPRKSVDTNGMAFARKSVDTSERARETPVCKELPRFSTDTKEPANQLLDIRDIVRVPFRKEPQIDRKDRTNEAREPIRAVNPPRLSTDRKDLPRAFESQDTGNSSNDGLAVKEVTTPSYHVKDSPKSVFKSKEAGTARELNESSRVLAKRREPPWNFVDSSSSRDVPRPSLDGPRFSFSKDVPRNSYDGREPPRSSSFDYKDALKGSQKVKEPPRLSLDGKLASKSSAVDSAARFMEREAGKASSKTALDRKVSSRPHFNMGKGSSNIECEMLESLTDGKRSSSTNVVARLMGLEEMPATAPGSQSNFEPKRPSTSTSSSEAKVIQELLGSKSLEPKLSSDSMHNLSSKTALAAKFSSPTRRSQQDNRSFLPFKHWDDVHNVSYHQDEVEQPPPPYPEPDANRAGSISIWKHPEAGLNYSLAPKARAEDFSNQRKARGSLHREEFQAFAGHVETSPPASKLCEPNTDAFYKEVEKNLRKLGLLQNSEQELQALKQLLESIQLNEHSPRPPHSEHPEVQHSQTVRQQCSMTHDSMFYGAGYSKQESCYERDSILMGQVTPEWRQKKMQEHQQVISTPDYSRSASAVKGYRKPGSSSVQVTADASDFQMMKTATRSGRSRCSSPDGSSLHHTRRTRESTNGFNTVTGGATGSAGRLGKSQAGFSSYVAPRETASHQQQHMNNTLRSKGPNSAGRTQSSTTRGNAQKQSRKPENGRKEKVAGCIIKDKEESRANLISLKSQSARSNVSADSGRSSADVESKLQNQKKSSNTTGSFETNNKMKVKKVVERTSSDNKGTCSEKLRMDGNTHFVSRNATFGSRTKALEMPCDIDEVGFEFDSHRAECPQETESGHISGGAAVQLHMADSHWSEVEDRGAGLEQVFSDGRRTEEIRGPRIHRSIIVRATKGGAENDLQHLEPQNEDTESQGEKSTGNFEQPSPVSVLDASFYQDDHSPMASTKCALKFHELEACGFGDAENERKWDCPRDAEDDASEERTASTRELENRPIWDVECETLLNEEQDDELEYIREILTAAGLMGSQMDTSSGKWSSDVPLEPELFFVLERKRSNGAARRRWECTPSPSSDDEEDDERSMTKKGLEVSRRRLLFDAVNVVLARKLSTSNNKVDQLNKISFSIIISSSSSSSRGGTRLLKEVWEDIGRLQQASSTNSTNRHCEDMEDREDLCDTLLHLLEADMSDPSNQWNDYCAEKGEIGLDLERLIFKDLVDETIRDLSCPAPSSSSSYQDSSRSRRRQLFQPRS